MISEAEKAQELEALFRRCGFRAEPQERSFAVAKPPPELIQAPDSSRWLMNYDWADIGLRTPFLDQAL